MNHDQDTAQNFPGTDEAQMFAKASIPILSLTLEVFLRHNFGKRYITDQMTNLFGMIFLTGGFGILLLLLVMPMFTATSHPTPFVLFFVCFFVMCMVHRVTGALGRATGTKLREYKVENRENLYFEDSPYYPGTSWKFWRWLGVREQRTIQLYGEPLLCGAVGYGLLSVNSGLGGWVLLGSACMFVNGQMAKAAYDKIIDNAIHQQIVGSVINQDLEEERRIKPLGSSGGKVHTVRPNIRDGRR